MSLKLINDLYEVSAADMHMFKTTRTAPLARATDPQTSHNAAARAATFRVQRIKTIMDCLRANGAMVPRQIEAATGLDYHAIQRLGKIIEEEEGLITRGPDELYGQRYWRAK